MSGAHPRILMTGDSIRIGFFTEAQAESHSHPKHGCKCAPPPPPPVDDDVPRSPDLYWAKLATPQNYPDIVRSFPHRAWILTKLRKDLKSSLIPRERSMMLRKIAVFDYAQRKCLTFDTKNATPPPPPPGADAPCAPCVLGTLRS
jgi:hypothetical protein